MTDNDRVLNNAAYRRLAPGLTDMYPNGHFVGFHRGEVVGVAPELDDLITAVRAIGLDPREMMAVRVGHSIPEFAFITPLH